MTAYDLPPLNWSMDYDSRTHEEETCDATEKAYGDVPPLNWSRDYDSRILKEEMWDATEKAYSRRGYREAHAVAGFPALGIFDAIYIPYTVKL